MQRKIFRIEQMVGDSRDMSVAGHRGETEQSSKAVHPAETQSTLASELEGIHAIIARNMLPKEEVIAFNSSS